MKVFVNAVLILSLGVFVFMIFQFGRGAGIREVKAKAVEHNHAEWILDNDGKPKFKWKEVNNETTN